MEGWNLISFRVSQKVLKTIFVIDFVTKTIFVEKSSSAFDQALSNDSVFNEWLLPTM